MQSLRAPFLWLVLGWLLVAGATLGTLLPGQKIPMFSQFDKLYHAGTYLVLMLWFAGIYRRQRYLLIAAALLLMGAALEFGQLLVVSRAFELADLAANTTGIAVGLALAMTALGRWCQFVESLLFSRVAGGS